MLDKKFKIYLYFCISAFFCLLGIILFYSFGFKYNIQKNETTQVGAIIIKTTPKKVDIYKNSLLHKNNKTITNLFSDFVKINSLEAKTYNIKIKKEGYFDWEKNVEVKEGIVTELKNIVLLKKEYNKTIILENLEKDNIWLNNQKNKIVYQKKGDSRLVLFDIIKKEEKSIADLNKYPFNKIEKSIIKKIIFSENNSKIILTTEQMDKINQYLIDLTDKNKIYNLSTIFEDNLELKSGWNFYFEDFLFYIKNNSLYKFDYSKNISEEILKNVNSFLIQGDQLYFFVFNDNNLYHGNLKNLNKITKIKKMPESFDSESLQKITKTDNNIYLILSSTEELYFINKKNEVNLINTSVQNANFYHNNKRIIYGNNREIWIYYIEEKTSQPRKNEFENELITRFSGNINNIFPYKDGEHLFYREGNFLKFLEIDSRDKRNIFEIIKINNDNMFYSNDSLYYLNDNKIFQIDLREE